MFLRMLLGHPFARAGRAAVGSDRVIQEAHHVLEEEGNLLGGQDVQVNQGIQHDVYEEHGAHSPE